MRQAGGLVHLSGFERCIFSYPNNKETEEIPALRFPGSSVPIQLASLQELARPMHILEVHGNGIATAVHRGDESSLLPGQSSSPDPVQRGSGDPDEHSDVAFVSSGIHDELREILTDTLPAHHLLGVDLNSVTMTARLSHQRRESLTSLLRQVRVHKPVTALTFMRLLGMMSATHVVIHLGLLHIRRLQRWFNRQHLDPSYHKFQIITTPPSVGANLSH